MKSIFQFMFVVSCLSITTNPSLAQWVHTNGSPSNVRCLAISGTNLFAGSDDSGVFLSTDSGVSWTRVWGSDYLRVPALAVSGTNLFAGTGEFAGGVFLSTNNGTSWTQVTTGLTNTFVNCFAVSGTNLFAGTLTPGGVFLSTNNGTSWTGVNNGLTNTSGYFSRASGVGALVVNGTNLFASTNGNGIFRSTNNGTSWTQVNSGLTDTIVFSLTVSGTNLFAGTSTGGIFLSTNNGTSWTQVDSGLTNDSYMSFAVSGTNLFVGTALGNVYLSSNNGTSWTKVGSGLPGGALAVSGTNLFAGGLGGGGVWRRPLSEMITSVNRLSTDLPTNFSLCQNYPNPFNPTTTISFSLPSKAFVSLKVFDLLGNEVTSIISEELSAGTYSQQWNAANMSSGIYFYRLQVGSFTETKKLVLLR
ncbi:MAG: T9SS type A sorting domain-containing protein [Bacteroidota bacterium]|jgi:hypothetical protein